MSEAMLEVLAGERVFAVLRALLLLLVGIVAARLAARLPQRLLARRFTAHGVMLARRSVLGPTYSPSELLGFQVSWLNSNAVGSSKTVTYETHCSSERISARSAAR